MNCPHCNKVIIVKLEKDSNVSTVVDARPRPRPDPFATKGPYDQERQDKAPNVGEQVRECLEVIDPDKVDDKSRDFVLETRERYDQYGERILMSERQMKWLKALAYGEGRL